ncbi:hypothetical protein AHAS_Ahas03G0230500 [Arachis hypogaea]
MKLGTRLGSKEHTKQGSATLPYLTERSTGAGPWSIFNENVEKTSKMGKKTTKQVGRVKQACHLEQTPQKCIGVARQKLGVARWRGTPTSGTMANDRRGTPISWRGTPISWRDTLVVFSRGEVKGPLNSGVPLGR